MGQLTSSQILLEWSADPLSDTTPTYVTVSNNEIIDLDYGGGVDREGDDPEPGWLTVVLKNASRKWEPLFGSNTIDQGQRFRLTVAGVAKGVYYAQDFDLQFPTDQDYSEITITCADGFDVLGNLPGLDPPDAETYDDVIAFYEPWGHYPMDEPAGTRLVSQVRLAKRRRGEKRRRKIRRRREITRSELTGTAGPSGTYFNLPTLQERDLLNGDGGGSVLFAAALNQHARILVETSDIVKTNKLTVNAWVRPNARASGVIAGIVSGAADSIGAPVFSLLHDTTDDMVVGSILRSGGTQLFAFGSVNSLPPDTNTMVSLTWDGNDEKVYANGVEVGTEPNDGGVLATPVAGGTVRIGHDLDTGEYFDGYIAKVTIIDGVCLTAAQLLSIYTAGHDRGINEQTVGQSIAVIAASDLWAETEIQTSGRDHVPFMYHGQAVLEQITELMHAEGPKTHFFYNGSGDPVYLGHEFEATDTVYNTVQATFGDTVGAIPVDALEIDYDNDIANVVTASREGGPLVSVTDTTSSGKRRDRESAEFTDLMLVEDNHVESLADHVLAFYKDPIWRPVAVTVNASKALTQMKALDIGHLVRVKKSGVTGAALDVIAPITGKREHIDRERNYTVTYALGRGFDASESFWRAGVVGYSEAGVTTVAG